MFKIKLTQIPLYRGLLAVIITDDVVRLKKSIPEYDRDDIYASTYLVDIKGNRAIAVILNPTSTSNITIGVIAHEAYHAASFILDFAGHGSDFNDEPTAYLTEWCADRITDIFPKEHLHAKV